MNSWPDAEVMAVSRQSQMNRGYWITTVQSFFVAKNFKKSQQQQRGRPTSIRVFKNLLVWNDKPSFRLSFWIFLRTSVKKGKVAIVAMDLLENRSRSSRRILPAESARLTWRCMTSNWLRTSSALRTACVLQKKSSGRLQESCGISDSIQSPYLWTEHSAS